MANNPYVNKVIYGNDTVMDISDTTAEEGDVASGKTFYKASGAKGVGTADIADISNCYETTDELASTFADNDLIPFYDSSEDGKRNTTWSYLKAAISNALSTTYARLADVRNVVKDTVGWFPKNIVPLTIDWLKAINTRGTWSDNVYTDNGITYTVTVNAQGYVTKIVANGLQTGGSSSVFYMLSGTIGSYKNILPNDTYIMNGCPSGGSWLDGFSMQFTLDWNTYIADSTSDVSFNYSGGSSTEVYWYINVASGVRISNKTFTPMLRRPINTDKTFEAYHPNIQEEIEDIRADMQNFRVVQRTINLNPTASVTLSRTGWQDGWPSMSLGYSTYESLIKRMIITNISASGNFGGVGSIIFSLTGVLFNSNNFTISFNAYNNKSSSITINTTDTVTLHGYTIEPPI